MKCFTIITTSPGSQSPKPNTQDKSQGKDACRKISFSDSPQRTVPVRKCLIYIGWPLKQNPYPVISINP